MARSTIIFFGLAGVVAIGSAAYTILSSPLLGKRSLLTVVASGIALIIFVSVSPPSYENKGHQLTATTKHL
jgi:beta-1,4-N-acetylglucosaminyltransferase